MADQNYNLANIRALLMNGFDDRDLRRLCYEAPDFGPVFGRLGQETGKAAIIDELLQYATSRFLVDSLLAWAQKGNPARYERHGPYSDFVPNIDANNTVLFRRVHDESLQSLLESEGEVWMLGLTLWKTTEKHCKTFIRKVRQGGRLRVLILNPDKIDPQKFIHRFAQPGFTPETVRSNVESVLSMYKEIQGEAPGPGWVEVRLIDSIPSYGLYIFPREHERKGIIYAEIYNYVSQDTGAVPKFSITERDNNFWYGLYIDQFEAMWNDKYTLPAF